MDEADVRALADAPYTVERLLGAGAMGSVYAGAHKNTGRAVVVKIMKAAVPEGLRDRMRLEAQVLGRFQHENVVQVLDYGITADDRPYLVMERLSGHTLEVVLRSRSTLPVDNAVDVTLQLLAGLAHIHERGVVHRDIKPSNIFVCKGSGRIKLLDLGIAKLVRTVTGIAQLAQPTRTGSAIGTPRYMAPEQAGGRKIDARADLYAAGLVLYRMLAGRAAFDHHADPVAMLRAQLTEPPEPPSRYAPEPLPPGLDDIVLRALAKRPDERFASATAMRDVLVALVETPASPARASAPDRVASTTPEASIPGAPAAPAPGAATEIVPLAPEAPAEPRKPSAPRVTAASGSTLQALASTQSGTDATRSRVLPAFAIAFVAAGAAGFAVAQLLFG